MTMIRNWFVSGTDVQRITRPALLFGVALILGPIMGMAVRSWQKLPALPPGFEVLPPYNPSVLSAHYPVATVAVSSVLGATLLAIAAGVARRQAWARAWLIRYCVLAMVLWVIQGTLWVASALPQTRPSLRVMGVGSLIITPIGALVLLRLVRRLRCGDLAI